MPQLHYSYRWCSSQSLCFIDIWRQSRCCGAAFRLCIIKRRRRGWWNVRCPHQPTIMRCSSVSLGDCPLTLVSVCASSFSASEARLSAIANDSSRVQVCDPRMRAQEAPGLWKLLL